MVTISKTRELVNENTGEKFIVLDLVSEPVIKVSKSTGKPYLTELRSSMFCTFPREMAEKLVGTQLPGKIEKVEADEYEYTNPSTGEVQILNYKYVFVPEATVEEAIFSS